MRNGSDENHQSDDKETLLLKVHMSRAETQQQQKLQEGFGLSVQLWLVCSDTLIWKHPMWHVILRLQNENLK
jgi:hypothetical protein